MDNSTIWQRKQESIIKKLTILRQRNKDLLEKIKYSTDPIIRKVAANISTCGTYLSMAATADERVHINRANFCRERLCSICAWRRQSKFVATTYPALDHLASAGYKMVFITLTCKNCVSNQIESSVRAILKGWTKLTKSPIWKGVLGSLRALEVSYNPKLKTYHPHLHAILIMPEDYSPIHETYISQPMLSSAWRKAMKMDYIPVVHITLLRSQRKRKAYIETLKYAIKPADIPAGDIELLYYALKGKRLISFAGLIAHLRKALEDLDYLTDTITGNNPVIAETVYRLNVTGGIYEIIHQSIVN